MNGRATDSSSYQTPRVGLLGIMQELYDDMIPGITDTQGGYAQRIADQLEDVVDVTFQEPARNRQDIERQMRAFNEEGLDGVLLVMLTFSPAMRTVRALSENELPVMLANVQPERRITKEDMDDLTYNQGVHGAQDLVNTLTRMGIHEVIRGCRAGARGGILRIDRSQRPANPSRKIRTKKPHPEGWGNFTSR